MRQDIQFLRAVSVIAVICFHVDSSIFSYGYLGVDVFFLISGYLICPQVFVAINTTTNKQMVLNMFNFLKRRLYRIGPALGISVSFCWVLGFFFLNPVVSFKDSNLVQSLSSIFGVGNLAAFRQSGNYFNSSNPYIHYWSIGVEIQAYIFLSVSLAILYFVHTRRIKQTVYLNYLAIFCFMSLFVHYFVLVNNSFFIYFGFESFAISPNQFNFYFLPSRIWEFALGGICALSNIKLGVARQLQSTISKSLFILLVLVILNPSILLNRDVVRYLAVIITCIILSLKFNTFNQNNISKSLEWVGDRSYSLYLYHLPILTAFTGSYLPEEYRLVGLIFSIGLCFLLSNWSYIYVEKRFHSKSQNILYTQKQLFVLAIRYSYLVPILIVCSTTFVSINITKDESSVSWDYHYAASTRSKCPLGQITEPCVLTNNSGSETWLLIGDSHAGSLQNMIGTIANKNKTTLMVWNKCRFFDPDYSSKLNGYFPDWCVESNKRRIKFIRTQMISHLFIAYANVPVINGDAVMPENLFVSALKYTINSISKDVNKVTMLHSVPFFSDSIIGRPRIAFPAAKKVFRSQVTGINQESEIIRELILTQNFTNIDISKITCDKVYCYRYMDGNFLYVDNNHLSIQGARLVGRFVENVSIGKF